MKIGTYHQVEEPENSEDFEPPAVLDTPNIPELPVAQAVASGPDEVIEVLDYQVDVHNNGFAKSLREQYVTRGSLSPAQLAYVLGTIDVIGERTNDSPKGKTCMRAQMEKEGGSKKPAAFVGKPKDVRNLATYPVQKRFTEVPPRAMITDCMETNLFPYMQFPYQYFNPMQTQFSAEIPKDNNVVICAATSAGKTTVAEMIAAYTLSEVRKTDPAAIVVYVAPLKALCKEKEDDWRDQSHPFSQCNIEILTGDYILTDARKADLAKADIVCMSCEMLGSRIRRNEQEKNDFLNNIRALIIDEVHLLTVPPDRGPNLEAAIMKFTTVNKKARLIALSATMPNVDEIGGWFTKLNGKPTSILKSSYRPVELNMHYDVYSDTKNYKANVQQMMKCASDAVTNYYPNDKFIIFVHAKKTGRQLLGRLKAQQVSVEFHSADLSKEDRFRIEKDFRDRSPKSLRVLIATCGLAWGINMPARRVLIMGVKRGMSLVLGLDIVQMSGRAGRIGLDKFGDVHILINSENHYEEKAHCTNIGDIRSQINSKDILGFHLVSEVNERTVTTTEEAVSWYQNTLAYQQGLEGDDEDSEAFVKDTMAMLIEYGAIKDTKHGYVATPIGKISSWFYYSPFDVADWSRNFKRILETPNPTDDQIAWAVANRHTVHKDYPIVLDAKGEALGARLASMGLNTKQGVKKHAYALYSMITGIPPEIPEIHSIKFGYQADVDRMCSAMVLLNNIGQYFKDLPGEAKLYEIPTRLKYGVPRDAVELVLLPGIGGARAKALVESRGVKTCADLMGLYHQGPNAWPFSAKRMQEIMPVCQEVMNIGKDAFLKKKFTKK